MSVLNDLINQVEDITLRERIAKEVEHLAKQKKFGLVFEEHIPECTPLYDIPIKPGVLVAKKTGKVNDVYKVISISDRIAKCLHRESRVVETIEKDELVTVAEFGEPIYPYLKPIDSICNAPENDLWHTLIEADNYHALQLLEYLYAGKVDCIYIDPPYNTGAKDWKYNNDYVDGSDSYRHSKWLSFMQKRLRIAKKLLNPKDSVLIITIDEKEYLHLGCLLEEMFPEASMQMISSVINRHGSMRFSEFTRVNEYIYYIRLGKASIGKIEDKSGKTAVHWHSLKRSGSSSGNYRSGRPLLFYPIYVNKKTNAVVKFGEPLGVNQDRNMVESVEGCIPVFPIRSDGTEGCWSLSPQKAKELLSKGYFRVGKYKPKKEQAYELTYLQSGTVLGIENGSIIIEGYNDDGSVIAYHVESKPKYETNQWDYPTHDASEHGTKMLSAILPGRSFPYPKSLYAVKDCLKYCISDKKDALVLDFFSGSGTTMHAVNLLNAEDGGKRRCIMVTNNEVSVTEAKELGLAGYQPGDDEWEKCGIARSVTWPRTVCSITGNDINGNPIKGTYSGFEKPIAEGFKANANYFKLGFLEKDRVSLGMQFKELLPVLWMKAGGIGSCPKVDSDNISKMMILQQNQFAVLLDERYYMDFITEIDKYPEIKTVYIVTDSDAGYRDMIIGLENKNTYQLYRDYLDNFRINSARR